MGEPAEPRPGCHRLRSMRTPVASFVLACGLVVATVAACGGPGSTAVPSASPRSIPTAVVGDRPSPTPVVIVVGSPFDAGTLVVASNPLFTGTGPRMDDVVGQSRYWVATPLDGGRFRIDLTIGWGDC